MAQKNWVRIKDTLNESWRYQYFYTDPIVLQLGWSITVTARYVSSDIALIVNAALIGPSPSQTASAYGIGHGAPYQVSTYTTAETNGEEVSISCRTWSFLGCVVRDENGIEQNISLNKHYGEYFKLTGGEAYGYPAAKKVIEPEPNFSYNVAGLAITKLPAIIKPPFRTEKVTIPGRDGEIVTELGYDAYDKHLTIALYPGFDIDYIVRYFSGSGHIQFSNEEQYLYEFRIDDEVDYEQLARLRRATVNIRVQPYKKLFNDAVTEFIRDEERDIEIPRTLNIENPGNIPELPIVEVEGKSNPATSANDLTLEFGNRTKNSAAFHTLTIRDWFKPNMNKTAVLDFKNAKFYRKETLAPLNEAVVLKTFSPYKLFQEFLFTGDGIETTYDLVFKAWRSDYFIYIVKVNGNAVDTGYELKGDEEHDIHEKMIIEFDSAPSGTIEIITATRTETTGDLSDFKIQPGSNSILLSPVQESATIHKLVFSEYARFI